MAHPPDRAALSSRYDLADALTTVAGCPVCHLLEAHLVRHLDAINYEAVNDPGFRRPFLEAHGFCNVHAWQWLHRAFVLGTASLYRDLLSEILNASDPHGSHGRSLEERLARWFGRSMHAASSGPHPPCPICAWLDDTESGLIATLIAELDDPDFADTYNRSAGLCLPHLHVARAQGLSEAAAVALDQRARATETTLVAQLAEIMRKHDYRFSHEQPGDETGAAERAVAHAIGFHGLIPRS